MRTFQPNGLFEQLAMLNLCLRFAGCLDGRAGDEGSTRRTATVAVLEISKAEVAVGCTCI